MSLAPYTHIYPVGHAQRIITDQSLFAATTQFGRFIKLYPGDTHSKWAEILDCAAHGVTLRITRIKNNLSCSGASYKLGSIHFIPWEKISYQIAPEAEATGYSHYSYKEGSGMTWDEYVEHSNNIEAFHATLEA